MPRPAPTRTALPCSPYTFPAAFALLSSIVGFAKLELSSFAVVRNGNRPQTPPLVPQPPPPATKPHPA